MIYSTKGRDMRHDEIQDGELLTMDGEPLLSGTIRITRGLSLRLWTGQFAHYDDEPNFNLMPGRYLLRHGAAVDLVELKKGYSLRASPTVASPRIIFNSVVEASERVQY